MTSAQGAMLVLCSIAVAAARAAAPSIEEFAARPAVEDVAVSPDGHLMVAIETHDGKAAAFVKDRTKPGSVGKMVLGEPDPWRMTWCNWATNTRVLCGFRSMTKDGIVYAVTRLVAVDADGGHRLVLVQNNASAQGQFQDRVLDWHPGPADTVLIEADEGLSDQQRQLGSDASIIGNIGTNGLPAVFELNVVTGRLSIRQHARTPIRHWITDRHGQVRLGWGLSQATISYYARLDGDTTWRRLEKFEAFSRDNHFDPIAISPDNPNKAYAFGDSAGRRALWLIDLADTDPPELIFAHPRVDVDDPILGVDDRLIGVHYDAGFPMVYYTDQHVRELTRAVQDLEKGRVVELRSSSLDEGVYLFSSYSDKDPVRFLALDTGNLSVLTLGSAYPGRDTSTLANVRYITYPARDGTAIPGYLATPVGVPASNLPLIVMPHGGPIARDTWGYFFLQQYLLSRGFAVLQMNFRGSDGYGSDWFYAAHQDWGGVTYDDVVDGARWAIERKIADPKRVCIVGWSFGGYLALVGAQRNPEMFRCAVDVAGVSDLGLLIDEGFNWLGAEVMKRQIGTDSRKLNLNSPHLHAKEFQIPLLMLHGDMDAQVPIAQSEVMDAALTRAGKNHRFVRYPGGDHQFSAVTDRAAMLREIERFLADNLGPVTSATPVAAVPPPP